MKTPRLPQVFGLPDLGCPVIDMHGHMGMFAGAHLPNCEPEGMVAAMDRAGVRLLVFAHHHPMFSPEAGNSPALEAVRRYPERLRAYCAINPNYPSHVARELKSFDRHRDAYVGFKFLADYHRVAISDSRCRPVWDFADERGLLVLLHTWGGSAYDGAAEVRKVARRYRRAQILLGHSCHGDWEGAMALARDFRNVHLELCAVLDERGILERFVRKLGSARLVFGTDFPWFNPNYYIGSVLGAEISDADRQNIFYRNARRLLSPFLNV